MAARTAASKRAQPKRPAWIRRTKRALAWLLLIFFIGFSVAGFVFMRFYREAESKITTLDDEIAKVIAEPSVILSADGKVLYRVSEVYRKPIGDYSKIPVNMRNAILAAEDIRFFDHSGVDLWAMGRVLFSAARDRRVSGGGSTLEMQLAKRLYSNSEVTFERKLQDIALAVAMNQRLTKEQVLTLYLDQVFFGSGAYGVSAAADVYFGKTVDKLTLAECAMLARCVRRPTRENPFENLKRATENRNIVLKSMLDEGMITRAQYEEARKEPVKLRKSVPQLATTIQNAPYFVRHVLDDLRDEGIDLETLKLGGYRIYTTLDTRLQKIAEREVARVVRNHSRDRVRNAAFVLMNKDGQIKAEVGGVNYRKRQFNVITQGSRQPGSAFKPFVYAAAFADGRLGLYDSISNAPFSWETPGQKPWTPKNSNGRTGGNVSVRTAFAFSYNIPAARVMEMVGPNKAVDYAIGAFGFRNTMRAYPSVALGTEDVSPLELAEAYSVFMLRGARATPYTITRIVGPNGETVKEFRPNIITNVIAPEVTDNIDALMRAVVTSGTGRLAQVVPNARGKTGTTQDNRDAWFCGYSDGLIGIGWVANEQVDENGRATYAPMGRRVFGGTVTVQFWAAIMKEAHERFATPMPVRPTSDSFESRAPREPRERETTPDEDLAPIPDDDVPADEQRPRPSRPDPNSPVYPPVETIPNEDLPPIPSDTPPQGQATGAPATGRGTLLSVGGGRR